jgi:hypothetical protein
MHNSRSAGSCARSGTPLRRITRGRAWIVMAGCFVGPSVHAAVTVRFDPADAIVALAVPFTIDIVADINEPVVAWGLDLAIDDGSILSLAGAPSVGPDWVPAYAPDGDGLARVAFPDSVSGDDILLATIAFSADALGETDLLLGVTSGDLTEGFGLDPTGFAAVTFEPGHAEVIPEPGAVCFLALGALVGIRRNYRRRAIGGPRRTIRIAGHTAARYSGGGSASVWRTIKRLLTWARSASGIRFYSLKIGSLSTLRNGPPGPCGEVMHCWFVPCLCPNTRFSRVYQTWVGLPRRTPPLHNATRPPQTGISGEPPERRTPAYPLVTTHRRRDKRRGRDSNPRYGCPYTRFPSVPLRPLGHLSLRSGPQACIQTFPGTSSEASQESVNEPRS